MKSLDYELIDSGKFRKLERFGKIILNRPEVSAHWTPTLSKNDWEKADWYFFEKKGKTGEWKNLKNAPEEWKIKYNYKNVYLEIQLRLTAFKHIGIFPEQAENWQFIQDNLQKIKGEKKFLNLFAYTGVASLIAEKSGALVTNVDSVKQVLNWGRENASLNQIDNIRWILEDARKFVDKAVRRGDTYDGIIMDPPAFGYGTKKEKWKLENDLQGLLEQSIQLLKLQSSFLILNTYSPKMPIEKLKETVDSIKGFPKDYSLSTLSSNSVQKRSLPFGNLLRFVL